MSVLQGMKEKSGTHNKGEDGQHYYKHREILMQPCVDRGGVCTEEDNN